MDNLTNDTIARLVSEAIAVVLMSLCMWYFIRADARQKAKQQSTSTSMHVVTGWYQAESKWIVLLQTAVVVTFYFYVVIIWPLMIVSGLWLVSESTSLLELGVDLVVSLKLVPLISGLLFFGMALKSLNARPLVPNMLFSRQYSLVRDMYIDEHGFEGAFALPWSRVRSLNRVDDCTFRITYRRFPTLLTRLIKADTLTIVCPNRTDVDAIMNYWSSYQGG